RSSDRRARRMDRAPQRAIELRIAAELCRYEGRRRIQICADFFAHSGQQRRARIARPATEDDRLRIEQRADGGDGSRELFDRRLRGSREPALAARPRESLRGVELLAGGAADAPPDCVLAHDLGEILARPSAKERQLPCLAAGEVRPSIELAVEKQTGADAGAEGEEDERVHSGGGAAPLLAQGAAVRVALDEDRNAVAFLEERPQGDVDPA